jgi:hypothetical protein
MSQTEPDSHDIMSHTSTDKVAKSRRGKLSHQPSEKGIRVENQTITIKNIFQHTNSAELKMSTAEEQSSFIFHN